MNCKFWTWDLWTYRRQLRRLDGECVRLVDGLAAEEGKNFELNQNYEALQRAKWKLDGQLSTLNAQLTACAVLRKLETMHMDEPELLEALKTVDEHTPWWRALFRILAAAEVDVQQTLCQAGLSTEQVHFYRGQLENIANWRGSLLDWHAQAQAPKPKTNET